MRLIAKQTGFTFLVVAVLGCSSNHFDPNLASEKRELAEVYDCYMGYLRANERPPTELAQLDQYQAAYSLGHKVLKEGKYKVVWGVKDKSSGAILAYEATIAAKGGAVLMADGTVKAMTADQFRAANPKP